MTSFHLPCSKMEILSHPLCFTSQKRAQCSEYTAAWFLTSWPRLDGSSWLRVGRLFRLLETASLLKCHRVFLENSLFWIHFLILRSGSRTTRYNSRGEQDILVLRNTWHVYWGCKASNENTQLWGKDTRTLFSLSRAELSMLHVSSSWHSQRNSWCSYLLNKTSLRCSPSKLWPKAVAV